MDSLKQERDQALVDISNAARFLSNARQRELNGWLRELVQKIGKVREEDEAHLNNELPAPIVARYVAELPASGSWSIGVFQTLSTGRTGQPPIVGA